MIYRTLNEIDFQQAFIDANRDYFSVGGYDALYEFYNELDSDFVLDVVAICCEWTEYGDDGSTVTLDDLVTDFGYLVQDDFDDDILEHRDETVDAIIRELEQHTTVIKVSDESFLVAEF